MNSGEFVDHLERNLTKIQTRDSIAIHVALSLIARGEVIYPDYEAISMAKRCYILADAMIEQMK